MRILIRKLGKVRTVAAITLIGAAFSVVLSCLIALALRANGMGVDFRIFIGISFIIPIIVAPICCWPVVSLLLKVEGLEAEMRRQATFDDLTNLLTRRALLQSSESMRHMAERELKVFSILVIDLDRFKQINDEYGHAAGDEVLKSFAKTAESVLRKSDIIGRTGGEEFAAVLPNTEVKDAYDLAARLHSAIRESVTLYEGKAIHYTASMGIAASNFGRSMDIEGIFKQADKALYQAKDAGRNCTVIYGVEQLDR